MFPHTFRRQQLQRLLKLRGTGTIPKWICARHLVALAQIARTCDGSKHGAYECANQTCR